MTARLDPSQPAAGQPATATIAVRNDGGPVAEDVKLIDELAQGAAVRSASGGTGACRASARRAECRLGSLASGESATVQVQLLVDREPPSRTVTQHIRLAAAEADTELAERAVATLVEPAEPPQPISLPGMPVTVVTVFSLVLAARATSARGS